MQNSYPGWRSLLFLPVHVEKFVAKAHTRGADAYILDLEDSVPLAQKEEARSKIASAVATLAENKATALIRINLEPTLAKQDLEASVIPNVAAIVVPKVESAETLININERISQLETKNGLAQNSVKIIGMIESLDGLANAYEIANSCDRICAMTLGSEDFSADAGMQPTPETLLYPNQQLAFACRRAGIAPLGFPASIADYSNLDQFAQTILFARQLGFVGALCIHPKQAQVLNEVLTPSEEEVERAKRLITTYENGVKEGKGAVEFEGKMIDLPVVIHAKAIIQRFESLKS